MSYSTPDDLSYQLTQMLRKVPGVTTVYASKPLLVKVAQAVVDAVKNEPAGAHLVTVSSGDHGTDVEAYIGVSGEEAAPIVCRRAHDAIRSYLAEHDEHGAGQVTVKVGRIG